MVYDSLLALNDTHERRRGGELGLRLDSPRLTLMHLLEVFILFYRLSLILKRWYEVRYIWNIDSFYQDTFQNKGFCS